MLESAAKRRRQAWRWAAAATLGLLASGAPGAEPGCTESTSQARNRDGSTISLTIALCRSAGVRRIRADLRPAGGQPERTVLRETQRLRETPDGTARLIDVDGDGRQELELRGSCGTGPNCEGTIFRLNPASTLMTAFYRGGYFSLTMIDGYLVESGRASCCAWESHGYRVRPAAAEVTEEDLEYRIDVAAEGGEDGVPLTVECSFRRREGKSWTYVSPPSNAWLPLCEQYGKKYTLRGISP